MPYCGRCGAKNPDDALFCGACGQRLITIAPQEQSTVYTPPAPTPIFTSPQGETTPPAPTFAPPQGETTPPAPTFAPPQGETTPPAPTFVPPQGAATPSAPVFTPPGGFDKPAPTFNPPQNGINQPAPTFNPPQSGIPIPTFTPPQGGLDKQAPTFTPPAPTFTPPAPTFTPPRAYANGPACYYHPDEPAVAKCARCGKLICQDCFDNYGVSAGEYEGHALCYDCCQQLVAENIAELKRNKRVIKFQFILSLIGIILGFIFGCAAGGPIAGLIYGCVGGVFLSAVKAYCSMLWEAIKIAFSGQFGIVTVISLIIQSAIIIFKCIGATVSNTYHYIVYLKQTSGFIESDTAALRQMQDYMEYTLIRNMNRGVDIQTLLQQDSRLADNSYAHMVQSQGEAQAEANLRGCVATINENGEIIRSFAA